MHAKCPGVNVVPSWKSYYTWGTFILRTSKVTRVCYRYTLPDMHCPAYIARYALPGMYCPVRIAWYTFLRLQSSQTLYVEVRKAWPLLIIIIIIIIIIMITIYYTWLYQVNKSQQYRALVEHIHFVCYQNESMFLRTFFWICLRWVRCKYDIWRPEGSFHFVKVSNPAVNYLSLMANNFELQIMNLV